MLKKTESEDNAKYDNFYSDSKAEIITNESDIDDVFQSIYSTIMINIQKSSGKGLAALLIQSLIKLLLFQSIIL